MSDELKMSNVLFADLKTDEEKADFFLSGRGFATGVVALAIQQDVAMAYRRCSGYADEVARLRAALAAREADGGKAVAWEHTMDNTEGIPGNRPQVLLTYSPTNPFGRPGVDYSESFSVTSRALVYADATHYPVAQSAAVPDGFAVLNVSELRNLTFSFNGRERLEAMLAAAKEAGR